MSSRDTASNPRLPKASSAASRMRSRVGRSDVRVTLYQMVDIATVIAEQLAGKRIAVTGSTGFVGTALVERLLRGVPECELVLLVRAGKRTSAAERVRKEILKNDAFDRLRELCGGKAGFDEMTDRRIVTINGDVTRDAARPVGRRPGRARLVRRRDPLRSARSPSTRRSTRRSRSTCSARRASCSCCRSWASGPQMVAVSTCYVAGNRRGSAPEELVSAGPFDLGLDWRREVEASRRLRSDIEASSRMPERLREFRDRARNELGAAGSPALAAKTEQSSASAGSTTNSSNTAGPAPPASAGPTPTPTPRPSASRPSTRTRGTSRSRSCGRRSSSRPMPSPSPVGSVASVWPSP